MEHPPVDLAFVPIRRTDLTEIPAGRELLIVDESADQVHLLNPSAALVWSFADGVATLGAFASDLAHELGIDPRVVGDDLVAWAVDVGARGLLSDAGEQPGNDHASDGTATGTRRLTAGPHPGLDARFTPDGSRVLTVARAGLHLDARVDDADLADDLAAALTAAGIAVDGPLRYGDRGPAALYSVLLGRRTGPAVGLHRLHRGGRPVRRCRHRDDLLRITVAELDAALDRETGGRPLLDAIGLVRGPRLMAVDPQFATIVDDLEPFLRRREITRVDASLVALAPCDPPYTLTCLVLRPGPDPIPATDRDRRVAEVTLGALDLARGPGGTLSGACVSRLHEVVETAEVVRVPGRDALLGEVLARLA